MPFVKPHSFTANTNIQSSQINANNEAMRKYINKGVGVVDYAEDSVDTPEVVRGEYFFLTEDHQFTTGDMYTLKVGDESIFRDYFTGQLKRVDETSIVTWFIISESGKQMVLERDAKVFIHANLEVVTVKNYGMDYDDDGAVDNDGEQSKIKLFIDGVVKDITIGRAFEETSGAVGLASGCSPTKTKRRTYNVSYLTEELDEGTHTVYFAVDPRVDAGYCSIRNITLEVLYY